jgi:hypothetical protein
MKFLLVKISLFCTLLVFFSSGCANSHQVKENAQIESNPIREDTCNSKEVIVARGTVADKYKVSDIVGMSEDGHYWLFQNDRLIPEGDEVKPNKNASLTLWDNRERKVLFNLEGLEYASYFRSVFISSSKGKIYFEGKGKTLDFTGQGSELPIEYGLPLNASSYRVLGEINGTLYVSVVLSEQEFSIYSIPQGKPISDLKFLKNKRTIDVCEKGFYTIEQEGKKFEKVLLYLVGFDGNKQLIGDMAKADRSCTYGITILDASVDGRYILYSVGKTPTSLAVYDTSNKNSRSLCLGDGVSTELRKVNFWCGNKEAMAVIWDINDKEQKNVVLKKYKMAD